MASFLSALNFFATTPFYPEIADDLNTSVPLLGQATTLMILVSVACGLLVGPLADRYGFRRPLVIGVSAIAVNLIGTGLAPAYPALLGLSLVGVWRTRWCSGCRWRSPAPSTPGRRSGGR